MKKLLFAALLLCGLAAAAPSALAGYYRTVFAGYGHCGRPVYRQVYVRDHCHSNYYHAPVYYRSSRYYRGYDYDRSYRSYRSYSSRPRIAFSFGF